MKHQEMSKNFHTAKELLECATGTEPIEMSQGSLCKMVVGERGDGISWSSNQHVGPLRQLEPHNGSMMINPCGTSSYAVVSD
jgi:hypothetical protein